METRKEKKRKEKKKKRKEKKRKEKKRKEKKRKEEGKVKDELTANLVLSQQSHPNIVIPHKSIN